MARDTHNPEDMADAAADERERERGIIQPSPYVNPKVAAAGAAGAGVGTPAGVVVVWLLNQAGVDTPPEVASAIGTLVGAACAFVAGFYRRG